MRQAKSTVDYGPGKPSGDHCGVCEHYQPGKRREAGTCELVQGPILARMWCKLFKVGRIVPEPAN